MTKILICRLEESIPCVKNGQTYEVPDYALEKRPKTYVKGDSSSQRYVLYSEDPEVGV